MGPLINFCLKFKLHPGLLVKWKKYSTDQMAV